MAEAGDRDDNIIGPGGRVHQRNNKSSEWLKERSRMIKYCVDTIMGEMSDKEKEHRARSQVNEGLFYLPDHQVVDKYADLGGPWTDELEYYRPQITDCDTKK